MAHRDVPGPSLSDDSILAILSLEDQDLYRPSDVAQLVFDPDRDRTQYTRLRKRLGNFIRYHASPDDKLKGFNAWKGSSWKAFCEQSDINRIEETERADYGSQRYQTPAIFTHSLVRKYWIRALAGVFAIATLLTAGTAVVRPDIYQTLRQDGASAALNRLTTGDAKRVDLFKQAWLEFRSQNYKEAERGAHALLGDANLPAYRRADCYYLLGKIKFVTGGVQRALGYYTEAHSLYNQEERHSNLYGNALAMAKAYILLKQPDQARTMLDEGMTHYTRLKEKQPDLADRIDLNLYHECNIFLNIYQGDYKKALMIAQDSLPNYEREPTNTDALVSAYSNLGFLYALNHNRAMGQEYTLKAQALIVELGDMRHHVYNLINFVLLQRCGSQVAQDNYAAISVQQWIDQYRDEELAFYLDLAKSALCGESAETR